MKKKASEYYSVKETAAKTGWNKSLVLRKIKKGEIEAIKIGWVWAVVKGPIDKIEKEKVAAQ